MIYLKLLRSDVFVGMCSLYFANNLSFLGEDVKPDAANVKELTLQVVFVSF